jgi:hypothetical protein
MRAAKTTISQATLNAADTQEIHDFLEDADVVDGPAELRVIVAELWPELLHKVKPPRAEMH